MELNDSTQAVCENCGNDVSTKDVEIKDQKGPLLTKDSSKEAPAKKVKRRHCC
jgi:hypothetical protein